MAKLKKYISKAVKRLVPGHDPDFLIVGAQKSGTTSLHYYLNQHPQLVGSLPKEVHFFDLDENYNKGKDWYRAHFKSLRKRGRGVKYFESSPEYLYTKPAAKRIQEFNPNMKIIIVLREPVSRAFSSWNMYRDFRESGKAIPRLLQEGENDLSKALMTELYSTGIFPSFEQCMESELQKVESRSSQEEPSFVRRGMYFEQVSRFVELFGRDHVKVFGFKELIVNKKAVLNEILEFTGMLPSLWEDLKEDKKNVVPYQSVLSTATELRLRNFYAPLNEQLFKYLGKKLNW